MPKPLKDKIGKNIVSAIINEYGGSSRYSYNDNFKDCILYDDKMDPGAVLTIDLKNDKETFSPYFEIRLSDNKGRTVQIDCYEILFGTELYKHSSEKIGKDKEYIDEKIAYVGTNTRKTKKEVEKKIGELKAENKMLSEENQKLRACSEQDFLNSSTYVRMSEEITFFKSLIKLNESALANAEARVLKSTKEIKQIYEDNKRFIEHIDDEGYFVGITENWHAAWEYDKLQQEVNRLKGNISAKDIVIIQKDEEIKKMQSTIANLVKELAELKNTPLPELVSSYIGLDNTSVESDNKEYSDDAMMLKKKLEQMEKQIQERKKKCASEHKKSGKKSHMSDEDITLIILLRNNGYSIRDIARQVGYSVGWVHEIINRFDVSNS